MRLAPSLLLGALAAALTADPASAQAPAFAGVFAVPGLLCDCDPSDFVFRTTRPLPGYAAPDPAGPVVRTVGAGRLIEANDWDDAVTTVLRPAVAVATRPLTIAGVRRFGDVRWVEDWDAGEVVGELAVARGERIEVLTAEEGSAYFRYRGLVYCGDYPVQDGWRWERRTGEEAVWLRLTEKPGRPAAWVRVETDRASRGRNVDVLCETHGGCVPGFRR